MFEIMNYIMEKYGYLVQTSENGEKYVLNETIDALALSNKEKGFLRVTFESNAIKCLDKPISKEDRPTKVGEYDYGNIKTYGLERFDKPVLASIQYEGDQLVFEDYEQLDEFIKNVFIPQHVKMKVNRTINNKGGELDRPYPSIQLSAIVKLRFNEAEVKHIVELLNTEGIRVGGYSQDLDDEFENYDYIRTYANSQMQKPMNWADMKQKFIEFYETKDPVLRDELITNNMRLVSYTIWKIAQNHGIDQQELLGYGYEGLLQAVERFNPYYDFHFSTYAVPYIKGYMLRAVPQLKEVPVYFYDEFNKVKRVVEKEWGEKYSDNPEMLDEILELMIYQGTISEKSKDKYWKLMQPKVSLEEFTNETEIVSPFKLDEQIFPDLAKHQIMAVLDTLTPREKVVIELRFGLSDGKYRTYEEIAEMFNVTKLRISQIEKKALKKMRHPSRSEKLRDFYTDMNNVAYSDSTSSHLHEHQTAESYFDDYGEMSEEAYDYENLKRR